MTFNAKFIITCGAVFAAINGMAYGAWRIGDKLEIRPALIKELHVVMDQVQQNTNSINASRFLFLTTKREHDTLTVEETQERCQLAQALNWLSVEGCNFLITVNPPPPTPQQ